MSEPTANGAVLDASAVLALLYNEPGGVEVADYLDGGVIGTINLAEVLQKIRQNSSTPEEAVSAPGVLTALGVRIQPTFTEAAAARSAEIWSAARKLGLSLGDRCCLALAGEIHNGFVVTADTAWRKLPTELGIRVHCIR
jgi:ribonuclease VapC